MDVWSHFRETAAAGWGVYGVRDAVVFAVGFIPAPVLIAPFG
ncbi:UNVERIFIED_CONTAM: hypothetical protein Q9R58_15030 [Methylobacteriaceae bacterium AG10]|nr:hypothetical protein [Methylobacteriaceae bacterium AG10]